MYKAEHSVKFRVLFEVFRSMVELAVILVLLLRD
nr:MAG TPA: hypothetical protein [Bacteriophage sp.]